MTLGPRVDDARIIGFTIGRILSGFGVTMLVPAAVGVGLGEWNDVTALVIGAAIAVGAGHTLQARLHTRSPLDWGHAAATVALVWLLGAVAAAVPLYLSGHYGSFFDATFDGLAGLTTTGMTLLQDLDHLGVAMNLWRHVLHLVGGLGTVVVVLLLFGSTSAPVGTLNVPSARDERILPGIVRTSRMVVGIGAGYVLIGTVVLTVAAWTAGLAPGKALVHGLTLTFSSFTTGGFGMTSASVGYYHSPTIEMAVMVLMLAGALSFGIHLQMWRGDRRELASNIETHALALSLIVVTVTLLVGLGRSGAYLTTEPMFRQGVFAIVAAHTTTGLTLDPGRLIATDWGAIAPAALVGAMIVGGMAGSTAGGVKTLRIGIITKGIVRDIRRVLLPESALVVQTYHQRRRHVLRDAHVRAAATILLLMLFASLAGGMVVLFFSDTFEFTEAFLESTSAVSNTGLTVGILAPDAATPVKLAYAVQMWLGRLEFLAVFALLGFVVTAAGGRAR